MKLKSITLLFSILISFLSYAQDSYELKLNIKGLEDSIAYLGYHYGNKRLVQDTTAVDESGSVIFKGEKLLKRGVYFLYSPSFYMEFVVAEQQFSIETTKSEKYENMTITNSPENEVFRDFQLLMIAHQQNMNELTASMEAAQSKEDTSDIYTKVGELRAANVTKRDSLERNNATTYTAALLRLMRNPKELNVDGDSITLDIRKQQYNYYKEHFFDGIDFDDAGTMRAPMFHGKVLEYIEKVTIQNPDSVITSIDYILDKAKTNDEMYRYWLVSFLQKYQNAKIMGMDKVFVHIGDNYYLKGKAPWAEDDMIKKLSDELIFHRDNQLGLLAPQIYLKDTLLKPLDLHSIEADYIVLYFYSPTCGHCKKKTPDMLNLYHELESEGLKIMGVNVDTEVDKWKVFIKDFELDWINAADIDYKSNFRAQYNVRSTPTVYLLDKDKKIIAKKLDVEQLGELLRDRIAYEKSLESN